MCQLISGTAGTIPPSVMWVIAYACWFHTRRVRTQLSELSSQTTTPVLPEFSGMTISALPSLSTSAMTGISIRVWLSWASSVNSTSPVEPSKIRMVVSSA